MIRFLKDSLRELRHVVWPTRKETQKFFWLVLALIVVFGIYLSIFSQAFSGLLFWLKDAFWWWKAQTLDIGFDPSGIFLWDEVPEEWILLEDEWGEDIEIISDDEALENLEEVDSEE